MSCFLYSPLGSSDLLPPATTVRRRSVETATEILFISGQEMRNAVVRVLIRDRHSVLDVPLPLRTRQNLVTDGGAIFVGGRVVESLQKIMLVQHNHNPNVS